MPLNVPGLLVPFQLLFNPRMVLPNIVVKDIRHLDFSALYKAGYRGAVFDKDNCLTRPHKDAIIPEIQEAWDECRKTFGEGNVLLVSNSAGTPLDPSGIQSEAVAHNACVPVLFHRSFKPAYSCIKDIQNYFVSLHDPVPDEELIIVGDRIFTDVVMANRMKAKRYFGRPWDEEIFEDAGTQKRHPRGPLAVWTTGVWEKEASTMRWGEKRLVEVVQRWTTANKDPSLKPFIRDESSRTQSDVGGGGEAV